MEINEDQEFIPGPDEMEEGAELEQEFEAERGEEMDAGDESEDEAEDPGREIITVDQWFYTFLISAIPVIGLIMLFVWAFGKDTNPNKANWAKASLLIAGIVIVLYFFITEFFFGTTNWLAGD